METKCLLCFPPCCCPLASFEHVFRESHGAVQADGVIPSQVIILLFPLFFLQTENYEKSILPPTCSGF